MKFITLPSGLIINLEQVAYVESSGISGNLKADEGRLEVYFPAMASAQQPQGIGSAGALHCSLKGDDISAFLAGLTLSGVDTSAIQITVTKKRN
jgi:hypothetical protein